MHQKDSRAEAVIGAAEDEGRARKRRVLLTVMGTALTVQKKKKGSECTTATSTKRSHRVKMRTPFTRALSKIRKFSKGITSHLRMDYLNRSQIAIKRVSGIMQFLKVTVRT